MPIINYNLHRSTHWFVRQVACGTISLFTIALIGTFAQAQELQPSSSASSQVISGRTERETSIPPSLRMRDTGPVAINTMRSPLNASTQTSGGELLTPRIPANQITANTARRLSDSGNPARPMPINSANSPRSQSAESVQNSIRPAAFEAASEVPMTVSSMQVEPTPQPNWIDDINARVAASEKLESETAESFIQREISEAPSTSTPTQDLVMNIGVNLVFVLLAAFGVLLLIKSWLGVKGAKASTGKTLGTLNVSQVLKLTNGAALHVVVGAQDKFLVAIDASGIKSVNVLNASFEQALRDTQEVEETGRAARRGENPSRQERKDVGAHVNQAEPTPEIDEQLIKLLLRKSPQAA